MSASAALALACPGGVVQGLPNTPQLAQHRWSPHRSRRAGMTKLQIQHRLPG